MIRVVIAGVLVLAGVCTLMVSAAGVFRFSHMLNMIHAAAKCDT
ncbi:MAG: monovalent cation/H(+) antiporter subunit G, partial [Synergistaceae bacterium]|nr:monovalent cation/H(+) antiporter subunit G [Synergistaceae bacterium]